MTRSRKASGKLTTKQLGQQVNEIQQVLNQLINAMSNDMARINGIMYALLQEDGRLEESKCPACEQVLFEPNISSTSSNNAQGSTTTPLPIIENLFFLTITECSNINV